MYTRTNPYIARIKERTILTGPASTKRTYHLSLDIENSNLSFKVGDSIGVVPQNHPETVDRIIHKLGAREDEPIYDSRSNTTLSFREFLLTKANINKCSFHKIYEIEKTSLPLLCLIERHKPHPVELCKTLLPLLPRFYSIASSPKIFPNEIHLTVSYVEYVIEAQVQYGVGSRFLCYQAQIESTPIPIYVQPSNHFTLPEDPNAPIVMIGPGTGIAPFRAFLQERLAMQSKGLNWLFFGERNRASDFYYSDYFLELEKQGRLRLETAFSRDQEGKVYVQHRMLEQKKDLWKWIERGCYIYVCGDAEKMAKDVDRALQTILHDEGKMSEEDARNTLKKMRHEKKYLLDVY